ncbi:MAG: TlpA family protein disulfide reductase [Candidatus Eremiobacteraeota bacterium]|nr:TlpA family protein disulfide reductase [Candidatus Eremiobacteraeota bacterium]
MIALRRNAARGLDVLAVLIVLAAVVRFAVIPRLYHPAPAAAPHVALPALDGTRFDLARAAGRTVFLDFYATWCDPCRDSIPLVQRFRRSHPDVVVESIDVGEPAELVRPFAAHFGMRDVALDTDQTVAHAFGVQGFPTLIAIGPDGRIRARWIGFDPAIEREMDGQLRVSAR